ncbi:hypothetical protein CYMTET_37144 [Cymbomonas tetramitiformis]|uniref:Uncharacterized protein n=1 Tax=Cymbomonas tetramitiformis TaxID=36881 RepID=A0AAE0CGA5_9CHLO|nr:hypothetical protein CYMTET_37503 [Cymbomonas tetramitiformis]KAK3253610.1 hypothetical protein CYMTET_37144 [Cymbomonas tetramitiformis]
MSADGRTKLLQHLGTGELAQWRAGLYTFASGDGPAALRTHAKKGHQETFQALIASLPAPVASAKRRRSSAVTIASLKKHFKGSEAFGAKDPRQLAFNDDLCLLVAKGLMSIRLVENPWFRRLIWRQEPRVTIPSRREFKNKLLPDFGSRNEEVNVTADLKAALSISLAFDLWMSRKYEDVFSIVGYHMDELWDFRLHNLGLLNP